MTIRVRARSTEEQAELTRMARSRTLCAGRVKRAQLVLLAAEGHTAKGIAGILRLHARTARFWLKRFNAHGLAGLEESARPGRPPVYPAEQVATVIGAALTRPADLGLPFASWTLDRLAAYLSETKGIAMRRSRIDEILLAEGLRWRRQETWFGERVDPGFAGKRGASRRSTPRRPRAASSSAWTRWARSAPRATWAATWCGHTHHPRRAGPGRRSTTAGAARATSSAPSVPPPAPPSRAPIRAAAPSGAGPGGRCVSPRTPTPAGSSRRS